MNKSIIGGVIAGLFLPVLAFGITDTREAILGLAPDEQILALADRIDNSKVESETKIAQLQTTVDSQNAKLAEQQKLVDEQNASIASQETSITETKISITKLKDCSADVTKYCYTSSFKDPEEFKAFLKSYEKFDNYSEYRDKFTKEFNSCQEALNCN
ncbi:MAG: hypothetical protein UT03_C0064G0006 [Candidatus Moranbacteria bacterium GW2011_GWD2_38_7]|nr:MAG: hypothetical protein UT03_C0064G0006 [Candidatus Moranbacteria bacterium GW2011_GWD2_38_7]